MQQREIKFRAWDKTEKDMIEDSFNIGDLLESQCWGESKAYWTLKNKTWIPSYSCKEKKCLSEINFGKSFDDDFILMQFTGLKDKNGTKIFEGDILLCETGDSGNEKIRLFVCRYQIPRMQFTLVDIRDIDIPKNGDIRIISLKGFEEYINSTGQYPWAEIIGNIYENPELLKG